MAKPKLFTLFELIKYCLFDKNKHLEREQNTVKLKKRRECIIYDLLSKIILNENISNYFFL